MVDVLKGGHPENDRIEPHSHLMLLLIIVVLLGIVVALLNI